MKKINWFVFVILILAGILAIAQIAMLMFTNAGATDILYSGNIETYINTDAVIVRDEQVIKTSSKDFIAPAIPSGEKVAKGELVARSCNKASIETLAKYEKAQKLLNTEIRKSVLPSTANVYEINKINQTIDEKIIEMMWVDTNESFEDALTFERDIRALTDEKIKKVLDTLPNDSNLKVLKENADNLNQSFLASSGAIKASVSGIVSFVVDGFESKFKISDFAKISQKDIEGIQNVTQQSDNASVKNNLKIIQNFYAYLVLTLDSNVAENIGLNSIREIRINDVSEVLNGELVLKNVGNNKKTLLIFKIDRGIDATCALRKVNIDVALARSHTDGLKIPRESLYKADYNNLQAQIAIVRKHKIVFRKIDILDFDSNYAIIKDANPAESEALQLYEEYIKKPQQVKDGDLLK